MPKSVSIRRIDTPNSSNRYTFVRIDTPYINYNSYICRRNNKNVIMTITEFFRAAPVLATILTLAYAVLGGIFLHVLYKLYKS